MQVLAGAHELNMHSCITLWACIIKSTKHPAGLNDSSPTNRTFITLYLCLRHSKPDCAAQTKIFCYISH